MRQMSDATREHFIILGALAVVVVGVVIWAVYFRRRRRRRVHVVRTHSGQHGGGSPATVQGHPAPTATPKRHRRRKRRRDHLPRNPTLAETSGLPPLRSDNPPEAFP